MIDVKLGVKKVGDEYFNDEGKRVYFRISSRHARLGFKSASSKSLQLGGLHITSGTLKMCNMAQKAIEDNDIGAYEDLIKEYEIKVDELYRNINQHRRHHPDERLPRNYLSQETRLTNLLLHLKRELDRINDWVDLLNKN